MAVTEKLKFIKSQLNLNSMFLIGGFVRDFLLGKSCEGCDLDIVTDHDFVMLKEMLKDAKISHTVHDRMLTIKLKFDDCLIDLVRARREFYKSPGVIAYCEPASIRDDCYRRDFTINTLMFAVSDFIEGNSYPIDIIGGLQDLREGVIRYVRPGTFSEDPARLIRLIRYAVKLDFKVEPATRMEYNEAVLNGGVFLTKSSRVVLELSRLFDESTPMTILSTLEKCSLIPPCELLSRRFLESADNCLGASQVFKIFSENLKEEAIKFFLHFGISPDKYCA
ncbi:MAG: hypothetical protein NZO16_05390 [Deltaproteobacteria bacterium]|nr:hypothetical protein [Deltaproteobacteria bacterium]